MGTNKKMTGGRVCHLSKRQAYPIIEQYFRSGMLPREFWEKVVGAITNFTTGVSVTWRNTILTLIRRMLQNSILYQFFLTLHQKRRLQCHRILSMGLWLR